MAMPFNIIIARVLKHEGDKFTDDPKDLGGQTKYGITKRFYPDLDIKNLTAEDAKAIYKRDYWDKNRVEELPDHLRYIFFDMCVNMGRKTAVKILQRSAVSRGRNIAVDGGMGPATLKAIKNLEPQRVRAYRIKYYADLVSDQPEQDRFYYGWYKRALEV